ncbi:MAG: FAD-dependent monooxygenase [Alphaproteobacteria bacterium]|nr:FAD-dependent monooxygenase [Alphaproteobacteria bacterium]
MAFPGKDPIIVAGAGPVGGLLALYLAREGFNVVLLEKDKTLPEDLRASTFHPPSMDMLDRLDLMPRLIELGLIVACYQYRDRRSNEIAEFDMSAIKDETKHPYRLQCEQWRLNKICCEELSKIPNAKVLFQHGVVKVIDQDADGVNILVSTPDGENIMRGSYVIGAEGANSMIRQSTGLQYAGFTYPEKFLVASTPYPLEKFLPRLAGVNYVSDPEEWCVVLRCNNMWRVLFPTKPGETNERLLSDEYIQDRLQHLAPKQGDFEIGHRTLYNVHQRVADSYIAGRVLLAGDAAHINNPLGGMGMNGGLHDAFNLAEKFLAVRDGKMEGKAAFDLYDRQRRITATKFVQEHTAANKKLMEEKDPDAQKKRQADFMRQAADPVLAKKFLLKTSMINVVRESYTIQ